MFYLKMIQRIKDLLLIKEGVDGLKEQFSNTGESVTSLKTEVSELKVELISMKASFTELMQTNQAYILQMNSDLQTMGTLKDKLTGVIDDFKRHKAMVEQKLLDNTNREVRDGLDRLKADVKRYNDLKVDIDNISKSIDESKKELAKFIDVSKNIKASDFEATKFANKIFSSDKEKLALMQKIDTLEHLISKMRRNQH